MSVNKKLEWKACHEKTSRYNSDMYELAINCNEPMGVSANYA